jgi:O-acetyl-ADP-ribose deacetylase (regulator of RNase III)
MKKLFKNIQFEAVIGDIAKQPDVEALVNAANAQLQTGGGVAGAIHRAAGPELYEECRDLAPIKPGEAVITKAYNLPNSYIIHCLGPVYGKDSPEEKLLANCYKNALRLAEKQQIRSIAFPSLSTGAFGYPIEEAVNVSFNAILSELQGLKHLQRIKFVLFSEQDLNFYLKKIEDLN